MRPQDHNCDTTELQMADALTGRMESAERIVFEAHLAECAACRKTFDEFVSTAAVLDAVPSFGREHQVQAWAGIEDALARRRVSPAAPARAMGRGMFALASIAALLAVVVLVARQGGTPPPETGMDGLPVELAAPPADSAPSVHAEARSPLADPVVNAKTESSAPPYEQEPQEKAQPRTSPPVHASERVEAPRLEDTPIPLRHERPPVQASVLVSAGQERREIDYECALVRRTGPLVVYEERFGAWRPVWPGERIAAGMAVRTSAEACAAFMVNGHLLRVGAQTQFVVRQTRGQGLSVELQRGDLLLDRRADPEGIAYPAHVSVAAAGRTVELKEGSLAASVPAPSIALVRMRAGQAVHAEDGRPLAAGSEVLLANGAGPEERAELSEPLARRLEALRAAGGVLPLEESGISWAEALDKPLAPNEAAVGQLIVKDEAGNETEPLTIARMDVHARIDGPQAITTVDQRFFNNTGRTLEGTYYFPVPPGAALARFAMYVDDAQEKLIEGEVVERQTARSIYESILRRKRDPALLEWMEGNLFKARIFPIPAHSEKRVILVYTELLPAWNDTRRYRFPLLNELTRKHPIGLLNLRVDVASGDGTPLVGVDSPSYGRAVSVRGEGSPRARADLQLRDLAPQADFVLAIRAPRPAELCSAVYAEGDERPYVLMGYQPRLSAAPKLAPPDSPMPPPGRDVLFIVETSGTRTPQDRSAQRRAVQAMIAGLGERDRAAIAAADLELVPMQERFAPLYGGALSGALARLDDRISMGALDLGAAVDGACRFLNERARAGRERAVIFLGAGIPAFGELDVGRLARSGSARLREAGARFVGLGVGRQVDLQVLDGLAAGSGGYCLPLELDGDLDEAAFELSLGLQGPKLLDPELSSADLKEVCPAILGALLPGREVFLHARVTEPAKAKSSLRVGILGRLNGEDLERTFTVPVPGDGAVRAARPAVGRFWARRHLDELLTLEQSAEVKGRIIDLAKTWTLMTPYTSFLVLESEEDYGRYGIDRTKRRRLWTQSVDEDVAEPVIELVPPAPVAEAKAERMDSPEERAKKLLEEVMRRGDRPLDAADAAKALRTGMQAYANLNYREAQQLFEAVVKADPDNADARDFLRKTEALLGVHTERIASQLRDLDEAYRVRISESMVSLGNAMKEASAFERAAGDVPEGLPDAERDALLAEQLANLREAKARFTRVREIMNWMPPQIDLPNEREAVRAAEERLAQKIVDKQDEISYRRRESSIVSAEAIRARETEAFKTKVASMLGDVRTLQDAGKFGEAEQLANKVLELDPFNSEAESMKRKARAERHRREADAFKKKYESEMADTATSPAVDEIPYANLLVYPPNWDQIAQEHAGDPAGFLNAQSQSYLEAGKKLMAQFDYDGARKAFDRARQLDGENREAAELRQRTEEILEYRASRIKSATENLYGFGKASVQEQLGQLDARIDWGNRFAQQAAGDPELSLSERIRRYEAALQAMNRASETIKWLPPGIDVAEQKGVVERRIQEIRNAIKATEVDLEAENRKVSASINEERKERLRRLRQQQIDILIDQARALFEHGEYEQAEKMAQKVLEDDPRNPDAHAIEATARDRRHISSSKWIEEETREKNLVNREGADRLGIPHGDYLIYPKNWHEIAKRTGDEYRKNPEVAPAQVESWQAMNEELTRKYGVPQDEIAKLHRVLVKQQQAVSAAKQNEVRAAHERAEMEEELNTLKQAHAALARDKRSIEGELAMQNRRFETLLSKGYPVWQILQEDVESGEPFVPDALVLAVKEQEQLAMISVGAHNGVKPGYRFTIKRGDKYIGKVQVEKVYPDMSSVKILPNMKAAGEEINVHDEAISKYAKNDAASKEPAPVLPVPEMPEPETPEAVVAEPPVLEEKPKPEQPWIPPVIQVERVVALTPSPELAPADDETLTIQVSEQPLERVLEYLSNISRINIQAVDENTKRLKVNLDLEDVGYQAVLDLLQKKYGLLVDRVDRKVVTVSVDDPANRVSMRFAKTDVRDVLNAIALQAPANIVVGPEVQGEVNLDFKDVPWKEALERTAQALDCVVLAEKKNCFRITTRAKATRNMETRTFRLAYQTPEAARYTGKMTSEFINRVHAERAGDAGATLMEMLNGIKSDGAKVEIRKRNATLVITDTAEKLDQMQSMIDRLDRPLPGVEVHVGRWIPPAHHEFASQFDARTMTAQDMSEFLQGRLLQDAFKRPDTSITEQNGQLVVMQTPEAHARIAQWLDQLRGKDPERSREALGTELLLEVYDVRDLTNSVTDFPGPRFEGQAEKGVDWSAGLKFSQSPVSNWPSAFPFDVSDGISRSLLGDLAVGVGGRRVVDQVNSSVVGINDIFSLRRVANDQGGQEQPALIQGLNPIRLGRMGFGASEASREGRPLGLFPKGGGPGSTPPLPSDIQPTPSFQFQESVDPATQVFRPPFQFEFGPDVPSWDLTELYRRALPGRALVRWSHLGDWPAENFETEYSRVRSEVSQPFAPILGEDQNETAGDGDAQEKNSGFDEELRKRTEAMAQELIRAMVQVAEHPGEPKHRSVRALALLKSLAFSDTPAWPEGIQSREKRMQLLQEDAGTILRSKMAGGREGEILREAIFHCLAMTKVERAKLLSLQAQEFLDFTDRLRLAELQASDEEGREKAKDYLNGAIYQWRVNNPDAGLPQEQARTAVLFAARMRLPEQVHAALEAAVAGPAGRDPRVLAETAALAAQVKQLDEARQYTRRALERLPVNEETHPARMVLCLNLANLSTGADVYRVLAEGIGACGGEGPQAEALAGALIVQIDREAKIAALKDALPLFGDEGLRARILARCAALEENPAQAAAYWAEAYRLSEEAPAYLHPYVQKLMAAKKFADVLALIERKVKEGLVEDWVWPSLVETYRKMDRPQEALRALTQAVALRPREKEPRMVLAAEFEAQGRPADAIAQYRLAYELRPEESDALRRVKELASKAGDDEARAWALLKILDLEFENQSGSAWNQAQKELAEIAGNWKRAGKAKEAEELRKRMNDRATDAEVVLSWDRQPVDIDLHVHEPGGSHVYYSAKKSVLGGSLDRDDQRGEHPETYMLRRARQGTYRVEVHYYGGEPPVTATVTVTIRKGSDAERKKTYTLPLQKAGDQAKVLEFTWPIVDADGAAGQEGP